MTTATLHMPPKNPSGKGGEKTTRKTTMKVAVDLIRQAKTVAAYEDIELFDLVDSILRPVIEERFGSLGDRIKNERKGGKE